MVTLIWSILGHMLKHSSLLGKKKNNFLLLLRSCQNRLTQKFSNNNDIFHTDLCMEVYILDDSSHYFLIREFHTIRLFFPPEICTSCCPRSDWLQQGRMELFPHMSPATAPQPRNPLWCGFELTHGEIFLNSVSICCCVACGWLWLWQMSTAALILPDTGLEQTCFRSIAKQTPQTFFMNTHAHIHTHTQTHTQCIQACADGG